MPLQPPTPDDAKYGGLLQSLLARLAVLLGAVRTRGELLQVEIEEERLRVTGITVFAAVAAFFLALAVLMASVFLILLFWDTQRVLVCGLLALGYLITGIVCAQCARQRARVKSKLFSASLAELSKDVERLK